MQAKYLVSTSLGDSILDPESSCYVQLSQTKYLRKKAVDLNMGDMVYFRKPSARTELEDVDPFLERSPRYSKAKGMLHGKNSNGQMIPQLRILLFEGLSHKGLFSSEGLEEKVMHIGSDFSKADYEKAGSWIYDLLEQSGTKRSMAAIDNWLRGETLAPSDWEIFKVLTKVNPEFGQFTPYTDDPKSMYFNYRLYVTVRRGIMRYLNACKGSTGSYESAPPGESVISLSPEYAIVFDHFIADKGIDFAVARVTKIDKILKQRQLDYVRNNNRLLSDGIVKETLESLAGSLKMEPNIAEDLRVIESFMDAAVEDYMNIRGMRNPNKEVPNFRFIQDVVTGILPFMYTKFGEGLDYESEFNFNIFSKIKDKDIVFGYSDTILNDLLLGRVDDVLKLERGNMLKLIETSHRLRRVLPSAYFEYKTVSSWPPPYNSPKILRPLKKKLESYGFKFEQDLLLHEGWMFFSEALEKIILAENNPEYYHMTGRGVLQRGLPTEAILKLRNAMPQSRGYLRRREETRSTLQEYGLEAFLPLRESDFRHE